MADSHIVLKFLIAVVASGGVGAFVVPMFDAKPTGVEEVMAARAAQKAASTASARTTTAETTAASIAEPAAAIAPLPAVPALSAAANASAGPVAAEHVSAPSELSEAEILAALGISEEEGDAEGEDVAALIDAAKVEALGADTEAGIALARLGDGDEPVFKSIKPKARFTTAAPGETPPPKPLPRPVAKETPAAAEENAPAETTVAFESAQAPLLAPTPFKRPAQEPDAGPLVAGVAESDEEAELTALAAEFAAAEARDRPAEPEIVAASIEFVFSSASAEVAENAAPARSDGLSALDLLSAGGEAQFLREFEAATAQAPKAAPQPDPRPRG